MKKVCALLMVGVVASLGCSDSNECEDDACRTVAAQLVFNEVAGTGADFAELFNNGTAAVDVSGYGVTDSGSDGGPRADRAVRFPAGTSVPAGGYLLVMMESNCPTTLPTGVACFRGESGISQTEGENVHLIDAANRLVATVAYPPNGAVAGRAWGRFPNGTGAFQNLPRTPGSANAQ